MKNFVKKGESVNVTIAGAAVSSGDIGTYGSFVGVYASDGAIGEVVPLYITGVYNLVKKVAAEVLTVGAPLYRVAGESTVRNAGVATDIFIGLVDEASGNGTLTVDCNLDRNFSVALV